MNINVILMASFTVMYPGESGVLLVYSVYAKGMWLICNYTTYLLKLIKSLRRLAILHTSNY